jgi:signal transduction histidine kinase
MGTDSYYIKPAGRHISTIGAGLIKDQYTAVVELVKNSFDADATQVNIDFNSIYDKATDNLIGITIEVIDDGHGMSFEKVTTVWMTPSTDDKLKRRISPKGRLLQGRKGIGRYAVSMLGNELILETIDKLGEHTIASIEWDEFLKAKFLSEVPVEVTSTHVDNQAPGTKILIQGDQPYTTAWNEKEVRNLIFELKKLLPPQSEETYDSKEFEINLSFHESFHVETYAGKTFKIDPFPLFKNYHYRIWGEIDKNGHANLNYHNTRASPKNEVILSELNLKDDSVYPGVVKVDFRVYDRDPSSIQYLIDKGLNIPVSGEKIGKRQTRQLLDAYNGIGVYRNNFRIRPLGDPGFDWLNLDKNRIQNPSRRIGSDQVIGFVHIESEERSGLEEKTARDGLRENHEYFGLVGVCEGVLKILEEKRYIYRKSTGLSRSKKDLTSKIDNLFKFDDLKGDIAKILDKLNLDSETKDQVFEIIDKEQSAKNALADEIQRIIAVYQGQATVGKIIDIVLHEGRRSLNYFKNEAPRLVKNAQKIKSTNEEQNAVIEKVINSANLFEDQTDHLARLFDKIDPLASRRIKRKNFNLKRCIQKSLAIFERELDINNIEIRIEIDDELIIFGWEADFIATFVNLIDNSLYWLKKTDEEEKSISFLATKEEEKIIIHVKDNGQGIPEELIESNIIFEPDFSTKVENGKGLGLAIAGESIQRNNGQLIAEYPDESGAFFKIILENPSSHE